MRLDPAHPGLAGGHPTAPGLALALADAWRPDSGLTREGGRDLDVAAVRSVADLASTGERAMADVLLSLWGEQPVLLARLDALDLDARRLLASGLRVLARLGAAD